MFRETSASQFIRISLVSVGFKVAFEPAWQLSIDVTSARAALIGPVYELTIPNENLLSLPLRLI